MWCMVYNHIQKKANSYLCRVLMLSVLVLQGQAVDQRRTDGHLLNTYTEPKDNALY